GGGRGRLRGGRPARRLAPQVDADHGARRALTPDEPGDDASAAADVDDDGPRPRPFPDGTPEEAPVQLERGVERGLEGVREAIVVAPRDGRDVAHHDRRTTRGRGLSRLLIAPGLY